MKAGVIVAGVAAAGLTGYFFYSWSQPFKAKVDGELRQVAEWTPENIQRDPENYFRWSLEQLDAARGKLEASRVAVVQQRARAQAALLERTAERGPLVAVFEKLKAAWPADDAAPGSWPVQIEGHYFSRDELRSRIIEAHGRLEGRRDDAEQLRQILTTLDAQDAALVTEIGRLRTAHDRLSGQLEVFRAQRTVEDIDALAVDVEAMLAASSLLTAGSSGNDLEALLSQERGRVPDERFDDIMKASF